MKRPLGPPRPPEPPPDPPIEMIRDDGCGSLILLVLAAGMLAFMLGLATGCTTSFEERDTWEDTDEDATDVADQADSGSDSLEVPEDTEDDGGGDADTDADTDGDTEGDIPEDTDVDGDDIEEESDPCDYYPTWYRDMDMDGYGRDSETVCFPTQPDGYVDRGGDCCDARPEVHPGVETWAEEPYTCPDESWDYNCDGEEEPRWVGASWDRCDPYCGSDCSTMTTQEECEASKWWEGEVTPPCGEGWSVAECYWSSVGGCGGAAATGIPQRCR